MRDERLGLSLYYFLLLSFSFLTHSSFSLLSFLYLSFSFLSFLSHSVYFFRYTSLYLLSLSLFLLLPISLSLLSLSVSLFCLFLSMLTPKICFIDLYYTILHSPFISAIIKLSKLFYLCFSISRVNDCYSHSLLFSPLRVHTVFASLPGSEIRS